MPKHRILQHESHLHQGKKEEQDGKENKNKRE
jgi:hypothetical protein